MCDKRKYRTCSILGHIPPGYVVERVTPGSRGSPVKVTHLLSFCYTTGLLHRLSGGGHHAGQSVRTFCGEKSHFRDGTWHAGTRLGSGPARCLVCPDGAEAVHAYLVVFDRLCIAQPSRLSHQALGAGSLSGPRRRDWGLPHLSLQQTPLNLSQFVEDQNGPSIGQNHPSSLCWQWWDLRPHIRSVRPAQRHSVDESCAGTERSPPIPGG